MAACNAPGTKWPAAETVHVHHMGIAFASLSLRWSERRLFRTSVLPASSTILQQDIGKAPGRSAHIQGDAAFEQIGPALKRTCEFKAPSTDVGEVIAF